MIPRSSKQKRGSRISGQSKYGQKRLQRDEIEPEVQRHVYTQSKPAMQKRLVLEQEPVPVDESLFEDEIKVEVEVKQPEVVEEIIDVPIKKKEGLISKIKNKLFRKNIDDLDLDEIPVLEQPFERREDIKAQIKKQTEPVQHFRPEVEKPKIKPKRPVSMLGVQPPKYTTGQKPQSAYAVQDYDYQPGEYRGGEGKVYRDTDQEVRQYHHSDQLDPIGATGDDEREFMGGKKLYDRNLMQQPIYDEPTMQVLNDIAADESFPILVQYITQLSHLGRQAQARLIARASAFQSKNQVFSNIQNQNDYMMAQDDFTYAQILSKADFSSYDSNADYMTSEAIMEAQFNIRLRRSRNALNLLQINTQRQESVMGGSQQAQHEERSLRSKIPFLGSLTG